MIQQLIAFLLFAAAAYYLIRRIGASFRSSNQAGCGKGCGCSADTAPQERTSRVVSRKTSEPAG